MDKRNDSNFVTQKQLEREKLLAKGIQFVDHFINRDYLIGLNLLPVMKTSYACENYRIAFISLEEDCFRGTGRYQKLAGECIWSLAQPEGNSTDDHQWKTGQC